MKKVLFLLPLLAALLVFSGCSDDEDGGAKNVKIEIETGETYQLDYNNVELSDKNDFVFYLTGGNTIVGRHEGSHKTTAVSDEGSFNLEVVVSPSHTLYVDLKGFIGAEKSELEKIFGEPIKENAQGTCTYGALGVEEDTQIAYENGKAVALAITFKSSYASDLGEHLADRYTLLSSRNTQAMYGDADNLEDCEVLVNVQWNNSYIMASYVLKENIY